MEYLKNRGGIQILTHVLIWSLILASFFYLESQIPSKGAGVRRMIILFLSTAAVFYLNYAVLIPTFLFKKKIALYVLVAVGILVLFGFVVPSLAGPPPLPDLPPAGGPGPHMRPRGGPPGMKLFHTARLLPMILWALAMLTGLVIRVTQRLSMQDNLNRKIEADQARSELTVLKSQISPHFLFNTLNNIYALAESDPKQAQQVIHRLSKMMRYMLYDGEKNARVSLQKEVEFIRSYVDLMKQRLPESVEVTLNVLLEEMGGQVPPMLFIPFVENAFKHGVSTSKPCSIYIAMETQNDRVQFTCENDLIEHPQPLEEGGIGLSNTQRRLELIYGKDNFELHVTQAAKYTVQLRIPLWD